MQQDADFITADFLYMFRVSCAHHQEYKILTRQPPVQVVMVAGGSSLRHIRDETESVFYLTLYYDAQKHNIKKHIKVVVYFIANPLQERDVNDSAELVSSAFKENMQEIELEIICKDICQRKLEGMRDF